MKVLLSWIREFVDVDESAEAIGRRLSMRGLALEGLDRHGDDALLDFDVTSNRPDCLSIAGIAREIATVYGVPFRPWGGSDASSNPAATTNHGNTIPISIAEPALCARYVGAVADVAIGPSPSWMASRLIACGVRPINNVVDITNYVLLERGHPMHAFDHARLAGPAIDVRLARAGESLTTLDGRSRTLSPRMLVIADAERATALGGVMGGADSEVSTSTRRIVFEAAWFLPASVGATSKALGLRTEASIRFERGADLSAPPAAMVRAVELLALTGAGQARGPSIDAYPRAFQPRTIKLSRARIPGLLGMEVPDAEVRRILEALGFSVTPAADGWTVTVPAWRVDVHREVDLIEEVGRHHGFERLPVTFPGVKRAPGPSDPRIARDARVRTAALAAGFSEAISFAFIEARHAAPFLGGQPPVALINPLSEKFAVMRPSLVPGLAAAVSHNRRHQRQDVQLFEIGTRFSPAGETRAVALAWTGLATPDHWSGGRRPVDFFDMKGVVEELGALFDRRLAVRQPPEGSIAAGVTAAGQRAEIVSGDVPIGWLGRLESSVGEIFELPAGDAVYVAELDLARLSGIDESGTVEGHATDVKLAQSLARFPSVVRDIALLVDDTLSAATVRGTIRAAAPGTLVSAVEFDRYQGKGIPDGKVSLAVRLTFQSPDRTLTDAEAHEATAAIVTALASELGAVQR